MRRAPHRRRAQSDGRGSEERQTPTRVRVLLPAPPRNPPSRRQACGIPQDRAELHCSSPEHVCCRRSALLQPVNRDICINCSPAEATVPPVCIWRLINLFEGFGHSERTPSACTDRGYPRPSSVSANAICTSSFPRTQPPSTRHLPPPACPSPFALRPPSSH